MGRERRWGPAAAQAWPQRGLPPRTVPPALRLGFQTDPTSGLPQAG